MFGLLQWVASYEQGEVAVEIHEEKQMRRQEGVGMEGGVISSSWGEVGGVKVEGNQEREGGSQQVGRDVPSSEENVELSSDAYKMASGERGGASHLRMERSYSRMCRQILRRNASNSYLDQLHSQQKYKMR